MVAEGAIKMCRNGCGFADYEKVQKELLKEREKFSLFLALNTNCFFEYDEENDTIAFAKNETFPKLNGRISQLGSSGFIKETGIYKEDYEAFCSLLKSPEDNESIIRFLGKDRKYVYCKVRTAVVDNRGNARTIIGCIHDNDDYYKKQQWIREQRKLDPLTGIYNEQFMKKYTDLFLQSHNREGTHGFLLIDLDGFKQINNRLGWLSGDSVLVNIVENIKNALPANILMGRIDGDEFALLLCNINDEKDMKDAVSRIHEELLKVFVGGQGIEHISCSIGGAIYPKNGECYDDLFQKADRGLFQAKADGKGCYRLYDGGLRQETGYDMEQDYSWYGLYFNQKKKAIFDFGQRIMKQAYDLLEYTRDVFSAVNSILGRIGSEFGVDSMAVFEKNEGQDILTQTYGWNSRGRVYVLDEINFGPDTARQIENLFDANGLCVINDTFALNRDGRTDRIAIERGVKACIQSAIYEDGEFKGIICLEDTKEPREFTEYEIEAFLSVARILSVYLLRLRISEKMQERLEHVRNFDPLTGVPTIHKFKKDALSQVRSRPASYGVISTDIENFKFINDSYGYQFGDRILYDFARSIMKALPEDGILGRVGADNFVALIPFTDRKSVEEGVLSFSREFHDSQKKKHIAVNLVVVSGIYVMGTADFNISTALDNANAARKSIKGSSHENCCFYDKNMEAKIKKEQEIANSMESALQNGEFVVYLQPKIELKNETIAGAEALIRWHRPDGSILSPDEFIPLFEKNGFIITLDFFVYKRVCSLIKWWIEHDMPVVPVSVNVSRIHLYEADFVEKLKSLVDRYGIPAGYIELELTEGIFVSQTENTMAVMRELRQYGFRVSIDDFGAGYSSLTLLKDMATDVLKLDKEFFSHGRLQKEDRIIISNIIHMAKQLDMLVLSEGIETRGQAEFLKSVDCDMVQGYYYAKPMLICDFENLIKNNNKTGLDEGRK